MHEAFYLKGIDSEFKNTVDDLRRTYNNAFEQEYAVKRKAEAATLVVNLLRTNESEVLQSRYPFKGVDLQHYFLYEISRQTSTAEQFNTTADVLSKDTDNMVNTAHQHYMAHQDEYYDYAAAVDSYRKDNMFDQEDIDNSIIIEDSILLEDFFKDK